MKKIKAWFKRVFLRNRTNPDKVNLEYVFTDIHGNNYYAFRDFRRVKYMRAIHAATCVRFQEMNLTRETLKKLIVQMKDALNNDDLVFCASLVQEIDTRIDLCGEENTLLNLAAAYIIVEGENPDIVNDFWIQKKIEAWKTDPNAYNFFLQWGYELTSTYGDTSVTNITDYLLNHQNDLERLNRFL